MAQMIKLTASNQRRRFYEDLERMRAGRAMDFSIGQHLELLMRRVEALEATAPGIEARSDETRSGSAEGESPSDAQKASQ